MLYDELVAWRGLDEDDLNNYYLVAEYIECLERFGLLGKNFARVCSGIIACGAGRNLFATAGCVNSSFFWWIA